MTRTKSLLSAALLGFQSLACQRDHSAATQTTRSSPPVAGASTASASVPQPLKAEPPRPKAADPSSAAAQVPSVLLGLDSSAYTATLHLDDEAIYLMTSSSVYRMVPGQPTQRFSLDLSFGATLSWSSIVYWSKHAVYAAPKQGGKSRRLVQLEHQPQYFVAAGDHLAWLDRGDQGVFTLQALDGRKPRVVYSAKGKVDAMTIIDDWLFFVERAADDSWRLGGISSKGGNAAYTAPRRGRTPAMLVAATQDIYYYDPDAEELRRISPDFQREETLFKKLVCSPFAVATKIYCAQVEGLFELTVGSLERRKLTPDRSRTITSVAANSRYVVWVTDVAAEKLAVNFVPVPAVNAP